MILTITFQLFGHEIKFHDQNKIFYDDFLGATSSTSLSAKLFVFVPV